MPVADESWKQVRLCRERVVHESYIDPFMLMPIFNSRDLEVVLISGVTSLALGFGTTFR
jgi:predicted P-loop ATPase/GTPase